MMGFDYRKIRLLAYQSKFPVPTRARVNPEKFRVEISAETRSHGIHGLPVLHRFLPPPGYRGHVELPL